jgi:hypothetical protein
MSGNRPRLVEFVGLAGCGKSFLRKEISRQLGIREILPDTKFLLFFLFFRPAFLRIIYASLKIVAISKPKTKRHYLNSFIHLLVVQVFYSYSILAKTFLILDEGFFHKVRALRRNSQYEFSVADIPETLLKQILLPDTVILIDVKPDLLNERRIKRDGFGAYFGDSEQRFRSYPITG